MVETGHSLSLLCLVTLIRSRDQSPKHSHAVGTKYLSRKGELAKREHYKMHISHITIYYLKEREVIEGDRGSEGDKQKEKGEGQRKKERGGY